MVAQNSRNGCSKSVISELLLLRPLAVSAGMSRNGCDEDDAGGYEDDEDAADDTHNEVEEDEDDEDGEDDEDDEVEEDEDDEDEEDEDGRGGTICLQYKYYDIVCPVVAHMAHPPHYDIKYL